MEEATEPMVTMLPPCAFIFGTAPAMTLQALSSVMLTERRQSSAPHSSMVPWWT